MKFYRMAIVALVFCAFFERSAAASSINFQFDVTFITGNLAGATSMGTGSYDSTGLTGVGVEDAPLTSFDFLFDGSSIDLPLVLARSCCTAPDVVLDNGVPSSLGVTFIGNDSYAFSFGTNGNLFYNLCVGHISSCGSAAATYAFVPETSVPEPSSARLLFSALFAALTLGILPRVLSRRRLRAL